MYLSVYPPSLENKLQLNSDVQLLSTTKTKWMIKNNMSKLIQILERLILVTPFKFKKS